MIPHHFGFQCSTYKTPQGDSWQAAHDAPLPKFAVGGSPALAFHPVATAHPPSAAGAAAEHTNKH
eukprot:scaffold166405_cov20-Tisochrysis_lutea.AAC.5